MNYIQRGPQSPAPERTEVLHPLFVQEAVDPLRIGHITDLHVDVRADVYEDNLRGVNVDYNNWNTSCAKLYSHAKQSCDVLLLTGDLIDYGRGHLGIPNVERLADDASYHVDRNWFLFYYLLASGNRYEIPVYTILGNHDWRINPYPPFAVVGAPGPESLINDYARFTPEELKEILRRAHGLGDLKAFSYLIEASNELELWKEQPEQFYKVLWRLLKQTKAMDVKHSPAETRVESIAWYLFVINPFLDFAFQFPGGYDVLMLDWAEDEDVLFPIVVDGEKWHYLPWQTKAAAAHGPKARNGLTDLQKRLVEELVAKQGKAKILCIHAPPIGPHPAWTDDWLSTGRIEHSKDEKLPGSARYTTHYPNGTSREWYGHPIYAVRPDGGLFGQAADHGSLQRHRDWLIKELRKSDAHVRLVLSGHIHRNGLFVVHVPQSYRPDSVIGGQMLTRLVDPHVAGGVRPPAVTSTPEGDHGPLYVNTTSAGPRGHLYAAPKYDAYVDPGYAAIDLSSDGTIQKIEFRNA
jgi:hypothetical protein